MFIAVDFDGTLCKHNFPHIGEQEQVHRNIMNYVKGLKQQGNKIILWTCREDIPEGNFLTQAVEWCKEKGLEFDYVNENPECDFGHPEKVRKIVADWYIDDKAVHISQFE